MWSPTFDRDSSRDIARPLLPAGTFDVSIVMPCLNEVETLEACIRKAQSAIAEGGFNAEIIIADNGSSDGSQELATRLGARVVAVAERGYGNALREGVSASRGEVIVMGDADDSYDFSAILPLIEGVRAGNDLVMGNRFLGGIDPGAMPWKHRWIGNPVLTSIGKLFFHAKAGDFHCGLRAFSRQAFDRMDLHTTGMEFASEMVIKAQLQGMQITEVPITLHCDGRSRPPHLRSWRDGWRHLRFMLLYSPRWLFLYPGALLLAFGLILGARLVAGPLTVGRAVLDIHTLLLCGFLAVLGYQIVFFAIFAKLFTIAEGLHPSHTALLPFMRVSTLEGGLVLGLALLLGGAGLLVFALWQWHAVSFGELDPRSTMRQVIPAVVLMMLGVQTIFGSFFLSVLGIGRR